jgi:hypothetical protein
VSDYDEIIEKLDLWIEKFEPSIPWTAGAVFATIGGAIGGVAGFLVGLPFGGITGIPAGVAGAAGGAALGTSLWALIEGAEEVGLLDGSEDYTNGGPGGKGSVYLNNYYYKSLSTIRVAVQESEQSGTDIQKSAAIFSARILLGDVSNYTNDNPANEVTFIPHQLWESVFTYKSISQSKFIASFALRMLAENGPHVPANVVQAITKNAIKSIGNGKFLSRFALGRIPQIRTAITLIPFSEAKKRVSMVVRDEIRNLKGIQIQVNPPPTLTGVKIFSLQQGDEGGKKVWEIQPERLQKGIKKVDQSVLTPDMVGKKHLNALSINWPTQVIGELDSEDEDEKKLRASLQSFDEISETTDLTTYKFKYWREVDPDLLDDMGFGLGFISSGIEWLADNKDQKPEDLVDKGLSSAYLQYILEVIRVSKGLTLKTDETTVSTIFAKIFDTNLARRMYGYIAVDKEIARRVAFMKKVAEIVEGRDEGEKGNPLTDEELKQAEQAGLDGFKTGDADTIEIEALDENAVKNMQKFYKQCALMMNIKKLRDDYEDTIKQKYTNAAYDGRFCVIKSGESKPNQETILTKLISSQHQQKLFELEPWQVSSLTPKLGLFKILDSGNGNTKEVEFEFERTSKIDRQEVKGQDYTSPATTFMGSDFDKGNGVGVKEFSIEFAGTNPAEARNDIKATLKLFFQTFTDFIRYRKSKGGTAADVYRYADLVIQPKPNKNSTTAYGQDVTNKRAYDAAFYRIRADLGYYVPDFADKDLKDAIEHQNKSFMLTMVDHDISFNKDGSVGITIEYRAYLESLLKMPRLDALASPDLIQKRQENATKLASELLMGECSVEQIRELQISLQSQEEAIAQKSLRSILNRLEERGVIYNAKVSDEDRNFFLNNGFFNKCGLDQFNQEENGDNTDLGKAISQELPEESSGFDFLDTKDSLIQFFYFGDLLYTILDCAYDENSNPRDGMSNNRIVLGSFEFDSFASSAPGGSVYGIDQMPISVDFFSRWFVDNVISQKSTRKTFPVLNFIRQLSNSLIRKSLLENCVNKEMDRGLRFQTGQVTAYSESGDPLVEIAKDSFRKGNPVINVDEYRGGLLPLKGSPSEKSDNGSYWNYIVLSSMGSTLSYTGNGTYEDDVKQGRFHVQIGQKSGLVKSISLSKTSQSYLKEARFFQNGIDGILQLSNVYVANVEMFGNTVFYPGMEFFFNPYGLGGGTEFGVPNDPSKKSIAWKMGIGGYHTVLSVKTTLTPGKFTTSIKGQQYYSGDGSGNSDLEKRRTDGQTSIEDYKPFWDGTSDGGEKESKEACNRTISSVQFGSAEEAEASPAGTPTASGATPAPVEEVAPETESEPPTSELPPVTTETIEDPEVESDNSTNDSSNEDPAEAIETNTSSSSTEQESDTVVITAESQNAPVTVRSSYQGKLVTTRDVTIRSSATSYRVETQVTEVGGMFTEMTDGTVYFRRATTEGLAEPVEITDHSRISKR